MADIKEWNPEDQEFWRSKGKKIANRNLWISIPSLLCGFAVWLYMATPEYALYGFTIFYFICLLLNWWYYLGPRAEYKNP